MRKGGLARSPSPSSSSRSWDGKEEDFFKLMAFPPSLPLSSLLPRDIDEEDEEEGEEDGDLPQG